MNNSDSKIGALRDGDRKVSVEGEITQISEPRRVNLRTGEQANVADAVLNDGNASIKLPLWDEQIYSVKVGSRYKIENGYVRSYQGELSLNIGRYGSMKESF